MHRRRIFVALLISEGLKEAVVKWRELFSRENPEDARRLRWIRGEDLHITLLPPWYDDEEGILDIQKKLKELNGKTEEFVCSFKSVSYGPSPSRPRLIWLNGRAPSTLLGFKEKLELILGKKAEARRYLLHLTIARFRPDEISSFRLKKLYKPFEFEELSSEFALMESHLSPEGAHYTILEKYALCKRDSSS